MFIYLILFILKLMFSIISNIKIFKVLFSLLILFIFIWIYSSLLKSFICILLNWIYSDFIILLIFLNSFSEFWMCFCILCSFILILLVVWVWLLSLLILEIFIRFFQAVKIRVQNKLKKSCQELHFLLQLRSVLSNEARLHVP